ncbi:hypothetical protein [Streptomyces sp. bgisy091]|uniref:hypothetical protein n=1 Tax=Streptomyces sp. bgisy091 TaxID=3413778 RepID=UPI003D727D7E
MGSQDQHHDQEPEQSPAERRAALALEVADETARAEQRTAARDALVAEYDAQQPDTDAAIDAARLARQGRRTPGGAPLGGAA